MTELILKYKPYKWVEEHYEEDEEGSHLIPEHFEGVDGVDWDLIQEVQNQFDKVINYENYASCDFKIYWDNFKTRYKEIMNVDLNENDLLRFQQKTKEIYDNQFNKHITNYYFYVLEEDIIKAWNNSLSDNIIIELCKIGNDNRKGYISVSEIDISSIDPISVQDVKNYTLRYHEIEWINQDIKPRITKINISAPMGTMFFLNGVFRPLYISNWMNPLAPNALYGVFNLDTNNIMPITRVFFPKEAAPIFNYNNTILNITQEQMKNLEIIVTVYYEEDI